MELMPTSLLAYSPPLLPQAMGKRNPFALTDVLKAIQTAWRRGILKCGGGIRLSGLGRRGMRRWQADDMSPWRECMWNGDDEVYYDSSAGQSWPGTAPRGSTID